MTSLYVPGASVVHRLPPQVKIVAAVAFVFIVVATPRHLWQVFVGYALLVAVLVALAGLPPRTVLRRMLVELPFIAFALLLPFVGRGPRIPVGPLMLSEEGLWAAWGIVAKATLGVAVAVVLSATTPAADIVGGLARLRLPALLVQMAGFMVRYSEVVIAEWRRMSTAMAARGLRAGHVGAWPAVAGGLGALFIRTFERGERIQMAMLARGFDGTARGWDTGATAPAAVWATAAVLPVSAAVLLVGGLLATAGR